MAFARREHEAAVKKDVDPAGRRRFDLKAWRVAPGRRGRRTSRRPVIVRPERIRRGIFLIPSLFTLANLFCGFYSIVLSVDASFHRAAFFLFVAIFFDALDGKVARLTHTTSDFGVELDSLCDVISFGVAPAVLAYTWALRGTGRAGWLVAFIYVVSGASRLARFNVQTSSLSSSDFVGLPIPAGAAVITTLAFASVEPPRNEVMSLLVLALMVAVAVLQVSTIRYPSFKHIEWTHGLHYRIIVGIAAVMAFIAYHPPLALLLLAMIYLLSGPIGRIFFKRGFDQLVADVSPILAATPVENHASATDASALEPSSEVPL